MNEQKEKSPKKIDILGTIGKALGKISFEWVYDKRVLMVLSVICSVVLWFFITANVSPVETKTINSVPITIDTEAVSKLGLEVIEIIGPNELTDRQIDVKLSGRRYALSQITAEDITVVAQVSGVTSRGAYPLSLSITCDSGLNDVAVTAENNQYITVRFDTVKEVAFTIEQVNPIGAKATEVEKNITLDEPYSNITALTIRGPSAQVDSIVSVAVVADVNEVLSETKEYDGRLVLYDANGSEISMANLTAVEYPNVALSELPVKITVPIRKTSKLTLAVNYKSKRAGENFDYSKLKCTLSPSVLTVKGEPSEIDAAFESDKLIIGEIDLAALSTKNKTFTFTPSFATGIEVLGEVSEVTASFKLSGYKEKTITAQQGVSSFTVAGDSDKKVTFETNEIEVVIVGPSAQVNKLSAEDLIIEADISGKDVSGACSVAVNVYVKDNSYCWAYGTYKADVVIE